MSTRTIIIIGAIVVVLAFVGGIALQKSRDSVDNPTPTPSASASPTPTVTATVTPAPVTHTIRRTEGVLNPASLTIRVGDTVVFVNDGTSGFWPASDPHPTHTLCPGFDARRALQKGETYTLAFTQARTCTYHNHLAPNEQGTINVR
jgi:plastocyanin